MRVHHRRPVRGTLLCSLCGREISTGEGYWHCNGASICRGCLADFARAELAPFHRIRGREAAL